MNIHNYRKPRGASIVFFLIAASIALIALVVPESAHAIDFPNIPGIAATDDPITIIAKVSAFIIKLLVFLIFAAIFIAAAYVLLVTLIQMVKDRKNAGDLIGSLAASLIVVVVAFWFLSEGEKAAEELGNVSISAVVTDRSDQV